jgi:site-specific DNA recombinase
LDAEPTDDADLVRCAIYTRQSVARPGDDPALASCAVQREKCLDFVRERSRHGWYALDEHFDDEGYSGANVERPALERLVDLVAGQGVDRIVVYRLDRLTRSVADWARIAAMLRKQNVKLSVVAGGLDTDDGSIARMQLNSLAVFAELEREMIGERLANARALRRANGLRTSGRVPLGYATDPRTKQFVVEPEATVVRWFFLETANGTTTTKLVELANRRGFATKTGRTGAWSAREVLRLLRNPTYAGRLSDGGPAIHTAVVEPALWDRVQAIIGDRNTRESSERTRPDANFDPFVLRGLLTCGPCGRTMTTSMSTRLTAKTGKSAPRYYRCRTPGCRGQIVATEAERLALEALSAPPAHWPEGVRARLREYAAVWDGLWPINRRRALAQVFVSMTWRRKP